MARDDGEALRIPRLVDLRAGGADDGERPERGGRDLARRRRGGQRRGGEVELLEPLREPLLRVEIIKNNRVLYTRNPDANSGDGRTVEYTFRDNEKFADTSMAPTSQIRNWGAPETGIRPRPAGKTAYYYVRAIQMAMSFMPMPMPMPQTEVPAASAVAFAGTIGGGCVEAEVWNAAREVMETGKPRRNSWRCSDPLHCDSESQLLRWH